MSSPSGALEVGSTVGDYQIISLLGRGGMGRVFKVRNLISDRMEAMKVLLSEDDPDADVVERFIREIKVVAALEHPNIAALRTALRSGNQFLMIMEYVEGSSLDQQMRAGRIETGRAIDYTCQVLEALSYAHRQGVVHRDIKPANVLVTAKDAVKVTDFGIASRSGDARLTATGMALGSLYYMSPEQIKADPFDARSDLYSVGVMLYEIVTGQRPVQGDSFYAILKAHLDKRPLPPLQLAQISAELSRIIEKSLEKNTSDRFQSADEFRSALLATGSLNRVTQIFGASLPHSIPPPPQPNTQAVITGPRAWDPAVLETARKNLAVYIGPMAKVMVNRAAKSARTLEDLYQALAVEITSPVDREKFLRSVPL